MPSHSPSWFVLSTEAAADFRSEALIPTVILTALALLVVLLRWYSRVQLTPSRLKVEDYLVFAALLLSIGITISVGEEFKIDIKRAPNNSDQLLSSNVMLRLVFAQSILYHLSINLIKASFIVQYVRLFSLIKWIVYSCYLLFALIIAAAAWGVFGNIFLCMPVQRFWDGRVPGVCMSSEVHFWTASLSSIILDWAIWILPMPVLRHLRLPRRQKMGLVVCFGLGGFVCTASILRLLLVQKAAHRGEATKSGTYAIIFSTVEVNIAIVCASLLVMKPLFARFIPAIVSEQPISAREDRRLWRGLTGMDLLGGAALDEEKSVNDGRRDTAIGMDLTSMRIASPENAWAPEGRTDGVVIE